MAVITLPSKIWPGYRILKASEVRPGDFVQITDNYCVEVMDVQPTPSGKWVRLWVRDGNTGEEMLLRPWFNNWDRAVWRQEWHTLKAAYLGE